ncbi:MAG: asparagine synthase (glutamine-hydrolyzing), partial [Bacillota bacterium]
MCGIAGFFAREPVAPQTIERMMDELRRRGPDAQVWAGWDERLTRPGGANPLAPHNALLHARLSIIDPRPEANQPMPNDTDDIWLCYNGEIYDWADHAAELRAEGVKFRTRSDSELILRAYERWGIECVHRLRGMFAFAILDLREQVVWIVRDRMGLKPLIYAKAGDDLVFGSTVRAVLPFLPRSARAFDADAIDAYLAHRYVPAPMTILSGVQRLENAHLLRFDLRTRSLEKRCYWRPDTAEAPGDWEATLESAIEMRTVADRPLGVFLSSGVDSSVIAARLAAAGHTDLHTFTAGFPGSSMDESPQAAEIARTLGLPNHVVEVPAGIATDFDRIVADLDEPFADPS